MIRSAFPLALLLLIASTLSRAQTRCPEGFRYVGTLSGHGSSVEAFDKRQTLTLPANANLDASYQQKEVRATNGKNGIQSSMRPQDVPKGFHLIPFGRDEPLYVQGWAVSDPQLTALDRDSNGKVTRYEFGMNLHCSARTPGTQRAAECSVAVDVCYKPLR
jgi:hypothetical protein